VLAHWGRGENFRQPSRFAHSELRSSHARTMIGPHFAPSGSGGSRASHGAQRSGMAQQAFHLAMGRGQKIAKVAMARKVAVRLYWMWRKGWDYEQWKKFG